MDDRSSARYEQQPCSSSLCSASINPDAAISAALRIMDSGMSSNAAPFTSIVRQDASPQTEQQGLLPTFASSHSSIGLPPIHIRFDSKGRSANAPSSIS